MEPHSIAIFLAVVACGSYIQTVTGFALGLIVMGATALFELAPLPVIAVVISLLGLANTASALKGRFREPDWKLVFAAALGLLPALLLGLWLLTTLHAEAPTQLRRLLGLFILVSGVVMMLRPQPLARVSPYWSFTAVGAMAGLFGGLFNAPGPPVVLFLYLQPLAVRVIRVTLLSLFLVSTLGRITLVTLRGELGSHELLLALLSLPVVLLFTLIGRRWPPPLGELGMRRAAFGLLVLLGLALLSP
jgi:uncharacterized membrane protein YfcA